MKKAALHNLGCKVNAYETQAMEKLLRENGYEIVPFEEKADVYIINTCTVTNIADRKSRQMLHRAKKRNPEAVVVAAGCYVQTAKEQAEQDEAVDLLIGNNRKKDLIEILKAYEADPGKRKAVLKLEGNLEYEEMELGPQTDHTRIYLKVQDGCNQFCSYCIIPYARGRIRSLPKEKAVSQVKKLVEQGYQEVVLTGIHISSYGKDFKVEENLLSLIRAMQEVDGLKRIRLGSLEPRIITEEFAKELARMDKVCPHFHLSLQSGAKDTLRRMNRHYTPEEYYEKCQLLRKYFANPALTTDVIVGFPGETEAEFEETKAFIEKVGFYETHIFKYSKRQGTRAAEMENQVSEQEKTRRSEILIDLGQKRAVEYRRTFLGKEVWVLFEEEVSVRGKSYWTGFLDAYVKAACYAEVPLKNRLVRCRITGLLTDELLLCEKI